MPKSPLVGFRRTCSAHAKLCKVSVQRSALEILVSKTNQILCATSLRKLPDNAEPSPDARAVAR